jgi:hypothetical protein
MSQHINPGQPSTADRAAGATEKVDKHQGPRPTNAQVDPEAEKRRLAEQNAPRYPGNSATDKAHENVNAKTTQVQDEKLPDKMKPDISKS